MQAVTVVKENAVLPAAGLDELIKLLRLEGAEEYESEQSFLTALLLAASDYAVNYLNRSLIYTVWKRQYTVDYENRGLALEQQKPVKYILPFPPVVSVDSVKIVEEDGTETEVESYTVDLISEPAIITNPDTLPCSGERIVFEYTAGYGETHNSIPPAIQQGILQHAAYMYNHRGDCATDDAAIKSGAIMLYGVYRVSVI